MTDTESGANFPVPCPRQLLGLDPYTALKRIATLDQPSPHHVAWAAHCVSLIAEDTAECLRRIDRGTGHRETERRKQARSVLTALTEAASALMYAAEEGSRKLHVTVFDLPGAEHLGENVPEQ